MWQIRQENVESRIPGVRLFFPETSGKYLGKAVSDSYTPTIPQSVGAIKSMPPKFGWHDIIYRSPGLTEFGDGLNTKDLL